MKALAIAASCALCSGCATTWITTQAASEAKIWDEQVREELVPRPGIDERLVISLPLAIEYTTVPGATPNTTVTGPPKPFALTCNAEQHGTSTQYHSAFRYGSFWKKSTAISFLVEGAIASLFLLSANTDHQQYLLYGGFFAADALVTGAIFFIPRKDIYREAPIAITTPLRSDCPDGLALAINGTSFPVDAAGHIGEVAEAALAEWMQTPQGTLDATFNGQTMPFPIGASEQCAYLRDHSTQRSTQPCMAGQFTPRVAITTFRVAAGTLTIAGN